jgi:hypothetical protein
VNTTSIILLLNDELPIPNHEGHEVGEDHEEGNEVEADLQVGLSES